MSLLIFIFLMIYIIPEIFVLLKNHLILLRVVFLNPFLRSIIDFYFFKLISFITYIIESLSFEKENILKDIGNLFRLKKN